MESSCEKTTAILNSMPYMDDVVNCVIAIANIRGFTPEYIYDVQINGEDMDFYLAHRFHRSLLTLVHVNLSFKDLIENPSRYIKDKVKQEKRRFANDNYIDIGSRFSRK